MTTVNIESISNKYFETSIPVKLTQVAHINYKSLENGISENIIIFEGYITDFSLLEICRDGGQGQMIGGDISLSLEGLEPMWGKQYHPALNFNIKIMLSISYTGDLNDRVLSISNIEPDSIIKIIDGIVVNSGICLNNIEHIVSKHKTAFSCKDSTTDTTEISYTGTIYFPRFNKVPNRFIKSFRYDYDILGGTVKKTIYEIEKI